MFLLLLLAGLFSTSAGTQQLSELPQDAAQHLCHALGNRSRFQTILKPLLVPRVVDTPQHKQVREYVHGFFASLGWSAEWDSFFEVTPFGKKNFHNLVVSLDGPSPSKDLVLACHIDSKILQDQIMIGAIDSAVPCAMMMDLARVMTPLLKKRKDKSRGLKMIFFDGEEAFVSWTRVDSLYGSRHLAAKWEGQQLQKIDVLMLLDLLGAEDPQISRYPDNNADDLFAALVEIEEGVLKMGCGEAVAKVFTHAPAERSIDDDHRPFKEKNVPILHLISAAEGRFPAVWHSVDDNESALHYPTIDHLNTILRLFVGKYFNVSTSV